VSIVVVHVLHLCGRALAPHNAFYGNLGVDDIQRVLGQHEPGLLLLDTHDGLDGRRVLSVGLDQHLGAIPNAHAARLGDAVVVIVQIDGAILLHGHLGRLGHYRCTGNLRHLFGGTAAFCAILTPSTNGNPHTDDPAETPCTTDASKPTRWSPS